MVFNMAIILLSVSFSKTIMQSKEFIPLDDTLPSPVILNGARILCREIDKQNDETE